MQRPFANDLRQVHTHALYYLRVHSAGCCCTQNTVLRVAVVAAAAAAAVAAPGAVEVPGGQSPHGAECDQHPQQQARVVGALLNGSGGCSADIFCRVKMHRYHANFKYILC